VNTVTSEKQKMLSGLPFNALDPELINERKRAKALCFEYNQLHPDQKGLRQQKLSKLLGRAIKPTLEPNFQCDYGYNISLGRNVYMNHNCTILDAAPVTLGDNVMIGPNVTLSTTTHPLQASQRKDGITQAKAITIADDVWIGMGVSILPGVSVGTGAVIAAGSVVTKDIPEHVVVAGVPASLVKQITELN
jgi:maltose O-acetyltransferase